MRKTNDEIELTSITFAKTLEALADSFGLTGIIREAFIQSGSHYDLAGRRKIKNSSPRNKTVNGKAYSGGTAAKLPKIGVEI